MHKKIKFQRGYNVKLRIYAAETIGGKFWELNTFKIEKLRYNRNDGGLSQWGRSNRPRLGTVKSERAMGVVSVSPPTGLCQENWPLSYVSLVRATNCTIGSGQYTLLSGRPVQTGQVLFKFKFTTAQSGMPWLLKMTSMHPLKSSCHLGML